MLPNSHNSPSLCFQKGIINTIPSAVASDFIAPVFNVRLRLEFAAPATVPEASVYKNCHFFFAKYKIRLSGQVDMATPPFYSMSTKYLY